MSNTVAIFEVVHDSAIKFIIDTYGYDVLQNYFEDLDNENNNIFSSHHNNNFNAKAIEHALL